MEIICRHAPGDVGKNMLPFDAFFQLPGPHAPLLRLRDCLGDRQLSQHIGVLPQPGQKPLGRPLFQCLLTVAGENKYRPLLYPPGGLWRADWICAGVACRTGSAERLEGALAAQRRAVGQADERPQLHQALGKCTALPRRIDRR